MTLQAANKQSDIDNSGYMNVSIHVVVHNEYEIVGPYSVDERIGSFLVP